MKEFYEKSDVDRILREQISKAGSIENFLRDSPLLTELDVTEAINHGRYTRFLLESINLRPVAAYERIDI